MALQNMLGELALEGTQEQMLSTLAILLASILEKMPRVDAADRLMANISEVAGSVSISGTPTTNVTTCANLGGRDASHIAFAMANIGTAHIYNNIQVS